MQWRCIAWEDSKPWSTVRIDRERLRKMEMTITKLRHHFPKALPKIVEDVDDWLARMDRLLVILKKTIHQGHPIDAKQWLGDESLPMRWRGYFQQLYAKHKELRHLLDALLYLEMTSRRRPTMELLQWIDKNKPLLLGLTKGYGSESVEKKLELQILFCILHNEMLPEFQSILLACFTDENIWSLSSEDVYDYSQQISVEIKKAGNSEPYIIPERPLNKNVGEVLSELLHDIVQLKPKPRRRATELLSQFFTSQFTDTALELSIHCQTEEARLLKILRRLKKGPSSDRLNKKTIEKRKLPLRRMIPTNNSFLKYFLTSSRYLRSVRPTYGMPSGNGFYIALVKET